MNDSVFVAIPSRGMISAGLLRAMAQPGEGVSLYDVRAKGSSLLAFSFNALWCEALNERDKFRWFVMCHDDIVPEDGWLKIMLEEREKIGADILHVVSPLRDQRGLTSTGRMSLETHETRRLSLNEISALPETFDMQAAGFIGDLMLMNTGLWICDMRAPWVDKIHFQMRDRIVVEPDGTYKPQCVGEDWLFSIVAYRLGLKLAATRKVRLKHGVGELAFPNYGDWGTWETDRDGPGMPFGIDGILTKGQRVQAGFRPPACGDSEHRTTKTESGAMDVYELLGRKTHELELLRAEYQNLLGLLSRIKAGEVPPERVAINMAGSSWALLPDPPPEVAAEVKKEDPAVGGEEAA
jgi:hypothetical protein